MEPEKIKRTLHWSLRHMLDDREPSTRQTAARSLLELDDVIPEELRDIALKVEGEEARTAFDRLLAIRPRETRLAGSFCDIMWNVPGFAEAAAEALMEASPDRNAYHAVIGARHVPEVLRRKAWDLLRPMVDRHDIIRLHDGAWKVGKETPSGRFVMTIMFEAFEALLARGATNEDLRILCLYVDALRERTWKLLLDRGPTKEDLEWTARSNSDKWDEAKALLARGAYVDAPP